MSNFRSSKPLGSSDVDVLLGNAENMDKAINSDEADFFDDRFGRRRETWHGLEKRANLNIDQAGVYRDQAQDARDSAVAAADSAANVKIFATHAEAVAAVPTLDDMQVVEIEADETQGDRRIRYRLESGVLMFLVNLDRIEERLLGENGAGMVGFRSASVSDYMDTMAMETDRLELLRSSCSIGRSYFKKGPTTSGGAASVFNVGTNMNGYNTAEWALEADADDFWRVRYGYTNLIRDPDLGTNATDIVGTFVSGSNPYFRPDQAGTAQFAVRFTGVGLIFQAYADPNGGAFSVSIDGQDYGIVSCWGDPGESNRRTTITNNLDYGEHTAVFRFIGNDPSHPAGSGGPRGYFKYRPQSAAFDTALVITGNEMAMASVGTSLIVPRIIEFPIMARPVEETGWSASWAPAHGSDTGILSVRARRITIDGRAMSYPNLPTAEFAFGSFLMEQDVTAYSVSDTEKSKPLWSGTYSHFIDAGRGTLQVGLRLRTLRALYVASGYGACIPADMRKTDAVQADNGFEKSVWTPATGTVVTEIGQIRSAVMFSSVSRSAVAVSVSSPISAQSLNRAYGADIQSGSFMTERSDNAQKIYWRLCKDGSVIPAGEAFRLTQEFFLAANSGYF